MKGTQGRQIVLSAGLALGGAAFVFNLCQGYLAVSNHVATLVSPTMLAAALLAEVTALVVQMATWALIMSLLGEHIPWQKVLQGYVISFLPRYIPGSVWGYLSRNEWYFQKHGIEHSTSNLASLIEVLGIVLSGSCLASTVYAAMQGQSVVMSLTIGTFLVLAIVISGSRLIPSTAQRYFRDAMTGEKASRFRSHWYSLVFVALLYVLLWMLHGASMFTLLRAFGFPDSVDFWTATMIYVLAWLAGFLALVVPAGLGIRESVLGALLMVSASYTIAQSSLVSVTLRITSLASELVFLTLWFVNARLISMRR